MVVMQFDSHALCLLFVNVESGRVFSWGRNSYGELGVKTDLPDASSLWVPQEIKCLKGVQKVRWTRDKQ